ncbi:hypothetical protein HT665_04100 [Ursidibacter maritimus]|uniref:Uncharacterized protein n=1 Tax=Ursidibacter maritimus TaxID=1331689 RepID=A0A949WEY7_9PAST|nr:hypothetical protein [Ursidibacter maritimus]KAE9541363.1 hypothetical protein A1D26_00170 [Ursidibacter maritimus]MBV6524435.1 hypothetical protein [Ursidibacter maritimus]MBV6526489.1 hypothetical protein [Ursidibacter maritimus]MBV6527107.1 hypothetical protein [Ursidibacter maritimus]MBV6529058.1 hypothetical protein [Ursidibacter maritimus]
MPIKDKLTKLKNRYSELLAETQESNNTWGDEFYDEKAAQESWECAKTFMVSCVSKVTLELASRFLSRSSSRIYDDSKDGWENGYSGFGFYVNGVKVDDDDDF